METLEFSTPKRQRQDESVTVDLAGEGMVFHRPKDATLWAASTITGDEVPAADRAMGLLQFVNGTLEPTEQKRFYERVIDRDDTLGQRAMFNLLDVLLRHWGPDSGRRASTLVAEQDEPPGFYGDEPVQITNADVGLDFVAYPPKDLALMMMASGISTGAQVGQQAWSVGFFLDACTDPATRFSLGNRMRSRHDPLELEDITDVVLALMQKWAPEYAPVRGNRAQRRAAGSGKASGGSTSKATSSTRKTSSGGARKASSGSRART